MHYQIHDMVIQSENAAKPESDAAMPLVRWLAQRDHTPSALDYGCGKLRYTHHLARRSTRIGICDSYVQLTREQKIHGRRTSVRTFAEGRWPRCRIHVLEDFLRAQPHRYDFILCANVLSAIPCRRIRACSLRAIRAALTARGQVLFVNQHTNSYFTMIRRKSTTWPHLDGWISKTNGHFSYYGILNKEAVIELAIGSGFGIVDAWVDGQSNYVLAEAGR
jgi:2-polyprenyl-3-methyl-5-hydroxy-6-metoxy-1,4-benzoquinol methylase